MIFDLFFYQMVLIALVWLCVMLHTSRHFCPNPDCSYRGWVGWGNLHANGHPNGGPWRQLLCVACHRSFLETLGTLLHGKRPVLSQIFI